MFFNKALTKKVDDLNKRIDDLEKTVKKLNSDVLNVGILVKLLEEKKKRSTKPKVSKKQSVDK